MIRLPLLLSLLLSAGSAQAQMPVSVKRGELSVKVRVKGTVVTEDVVRLKSSIEGRVEDILVSTYTWVEDGKPFGFLANKEMSALLDARSTTDKGILTERWRKVYQPTPVRCPGDCYVLRAFVKAKDWIKPKAVLFEAARRVVLVGRVRPEDVQWIRDGQRLEFWPTKDPARKQVARISRFAIDIQGQKVDPGGTLTVELNPSVSLPPNTEWEGEIVPVTKSGVLLVPTDAVIKYADAYYLPVRVSLGITTPALTEIAAGVDDKRPILVLRDEQLKAALRHTLEANPDAVTKRLQEEYLKTQPQAPPEKTKELDDPDANYGEDPYSN